ncbi:hypothetical protein PLESTF_001891900 [Pleodorina starrii]|nr:hypothetical protein PLESTF_001891900 [Pleodorina starrii]
MGKGGTKFCGDAVSVRRKAAPHDTAKNIKRNLDKFLETGVHPEIERARQERANQLPALPDLDVHRPFVFLDITLAGKPLGRLVVEMFDDVVPVAANHFRNRCMPGSAAGLAGTAFHKLLPRYALHGGLRGGGGGGGRPGAGASSSLSGDGGVRLQPNSQLRAVEGGLVAVALSGDEVVISLDRALDLDRTHQVVGRIHRGAELLTSLGDLRTLPDDSPAQRLAVARAGPTNHLGSHEELTGAGAGEGAGQPKDAATRLAEQAEEARSSLMDALSEGLKRKRKPDAADEEGAAAAAASAAAAAEGTGPSSSGADAGAAAAAAAAAPGSQRPAAAPPARSVKARMLDSMLGDLGSDASSSSSSDEEEDGEDGGGS